MVDESLNLYVGYGFHLKRPFLSIS
jgi:hypothetical protein